MGCIPGNFQEGKRQPIKVGKLPIKEGKRPINANGLFSGTPPWWKTAPLKRPIKRSMILAEITHRLIFNLFRLLLYNFRGMTQTYKLMWNAGKLR